MPEGPDYQLRRQVEQVSQQVGQLSSSVSLVSQQVTVVGQEQQETRSELAALRHDFLKWVRDAELMGNLQMAETKIVQLNADVETQFGHHNVVRRTAEGILQAFDIGLVTEETVRTVGEQLMIQNPRYWLAPVLVALAAWADDNPDLCERAVREAFRRSPDRTSLFMALVLRRQGRHESAVRWLRHYLNAQDPMELGRDFAVILESVSQGAFGPAGLALIREVLDRWQEQLARDEAVQENQVRRWRAEIDAHRGDSSTSRFPRLAEVSPQWPQMDDVLARAGAHRLVLDKYQAMFAEQIPPNDRIEDAVDDIIDRLVRESDDEELPLRRELEFWRLVRVNKGDRDLAQRDADMNAPSLENTNDYLTVQTNSALDPERIHVSRSTQRIAVASCHEWFGRAHAKYTVDYRMAIPPDVQAAFEGTHNVGASAFKLPRWTGSFTTPSEQLERSLATHWDTNTKPYIDGLRMDVTKKAVLGGLAALGVLIVLSLCAGLPAGLIVGVIVGGIVALVLYNQFQSSLKVQNRAKEFLAKAKQDSIAQLRAAGAELVDWSSEFKAADGTEAHLRTFIADFATAANAATPFERRSVHSTSMGA